MLLAETPPRKIVENLSLRAYALVGLFADENAARTASRHGVTCALRKRHIVIAAWTFPLDKFNVCMERFLEPVNAMPP